MGYPLSTRGIDPMADGSPIELGAILAQEHASIFRQVIVQVEERKALALVWPVRWKHFKLELTISL